MYNYPSVDPAKRREQRSAMAHYDWVETVSEWAEGGRFRFIVASIFLGVARAAAIVFWENIFPTLVSVLPFTYAAMNYEKFEPGVTALLIVFGLLFQAPLLFFLGSGIWEGFHETDETTDQEIDRAADRMEAIMEDIHKPLAFASWIILIPASPLYLILIHGVLAALFR